MYLFATNENRSPTCEVPGLAPWSVHLAVSDLTLSSWTQGWRASSARSTPHGCRSLDSGAWGTQATSSPATERSLRRPQPRQAETHSTQWGPHLGGAQSPVRPQTQKGPDSSGPSPSVTDSVIEAERGAASAQVSGLPADQ